MPLVTLRVSCSSDEGARHYSSLRGACSRVLWPQLSGPCPEIPPPRRIAYLRIVLTQSNSQGGLYSVCWDSGRSFFKFLGSPSVVHTLKVGFPRASLEMAEVGSSKRHRAENAPRNQKRPLAHVQPCIGGRFGLGGRRFSRLALAKILTPAGSSKNGGTASTPHP